MTIDSSWIACMKSDVPAAFTSSAPFAPDAVFIDGQIKLMCPNIEGTLTWDEYIRRQFERSIVKYLEGGVSCVILAFDDYRHVPCSKSMTQAKRRRNVPTMEFGDRSSLPPVCPEVRSRRVFTRLPSGGWYLRARFSLHPVMPFDKFRLAAILAPSVLIPLAYISLHRPRRFPPPPFDELCPSG